MPMKKSLRKVKGLFIVSNTLRTCCVGDSCLRFPRNCISEQEAPKLSARHLQFPGLDSMSSSFINVLRTASGIFFSLRVRCRGQIPYLKGWRPFSFKKNEIIEDLKECWFKGGRFMLILANIKLWNPFKIFLVTLFLTIYSPKKLLRPDPPWNMHREQTIFKKNEIIEDLKECWFKGGRFMLILANIKLWNPFKIFLVTLFLTIYSPKKLLRPDPPWNMHREQTIGEAKVAILNKFKCVIFFF